MLVKCKKCLKPVKKHLFQRCYGILCTKIYCETCFLVSFNKCGICKKENICKMCHFVWDICVDCLDNIDTFI
jgi:hypothetical protein